MPRFADNLRELMSRRRLSQRELADLVGISQAMISRWVRGENNPDFEQAAKVAAAFHVTLDMLISEDITKVTDREIERRRSLADAVAVVGIEEAMRRLLAPSPKPGGTVPHEIEDGPRPSGTTSRGGPDIGRDTVGRATTVPELAARLAGKPAGRPKGKKKRPKPDGSPAGGVT